MLIFSALILAAWVYLALLHGLFWKPLIEEPVGDLKAWPSVRVVVPARNEADSLPQTLPRLLRQDYPGDWGVVLVDDHSTDNTAAIACKIAGECKAEDKLFIVQAPDLPQGWKGKIAAMQAGVAALDACDFVLFTDADIGHPRHSLRRMVSRAVTDQLDAFTLMVRLHVESVAEKLLVPAFVFFFAMLYPFRRVNDPVSRVTGGAGGAFLVRRKALENAGGLVQIKGELIDDCALGALIKRRGGQEGTAGRVRLALARDVLSLRPYPAFRDIHNMIARSAFTQLRHSEALLAATVLGMLALFSPPFLLLFVGEPLSGLMLFAAWVGMTGIYAPMVAFYGLPLYWAFTLPVAALCYLYATLDSARRCWQGRGGEWKGRTQI